MGYQEFLESKTQLADGGGFNPTFMPSFLFDFQAAMVEWAVRKGRAALLEDCGLGKTPQELAFGQNVVEHTNGRVLHLAPLGVVKQTLDEAEQFGIEAHRAEPGKLGGAGIYVTNYERLHHYNPADFAGVVCDECFAAGTPVDSVDAEGRIVRVPIERVRVGDMILNAAGADIVADVHRREVPYAIRVRISGESITVSPNHPLF